MGTVKPNSSPKCKETTGLLHRRNALGFNGCLNTYLLFGRLRGRDRSFHIKVRLSVQLKNRRTSYLIESANFPRQSCFNFLSYTDCIGALATPVSPANAISLPYSWKAGLDILDLLGDLCGKSLESGKSFLKKGAIQHIPIDHCHWNFSSQH